MNFYSKWSYLKTNNLDYKRFINSFLNKEEDSVSIFYCGNESDCIFAIKFLLTLSIDELIENIDKPNEILPEDIMQFSSLENAISSVTKTIKLEGRPLNFIEIGKLIMNSKLDGACKKYGENHSKTAKEMSLVSFSKDGQTFVSNTILGNVSVSLLKEDKLELASKLLTRNPIVKQIIFDAKNGNADYTDITKNLLSPSTQARRKSNIKQVVELILSKSSYRNLLKNIVW